MAQFKDLGVALRAYRVAANESIAELASATELDEDLIEEIEAGNIKPRTDVLELIARHFSLRDKEAQRLLELAGYAKGDFVFDLSQDNFSLEDIEKEMDVLVNPVFYTDTINVVTNKYGVVINFIQSNSNDRKPIVVSRVGMSHEHAKSVIEVLQKSLQRANRKIDTDSTASEATSTD